MHRWRVLILLYIVLVQVISWRLINCLVYTVYIYIYQYSWRKWFNQHAIKQPDKWGLNMHMRRSTVINVGELFSNAPSMTLHSAESKCFLHYFTPLTYYGAFSSQPFLIFALTYQEYASTPYVAKTKYKIFSHTGQYFCSKICTNQFCVTKWVHACTYSSETTRTIWHVYM